MLRLMLYGLNYKRSDQVSRKANSQTALAGVGALALIAVVAVAKLAWLWLVAAGLYTLVHADSLPALSSWDGLLYYVPVLGFLAALTRRR